MKIKKISALALAVCSLAVLGLSACKSEASVTYDEIKGERVTEAEWTAGVTLDYENYTSKTTEKYVGEEGDSASIFASYSNSYTIKKKTATAYYAYTKKTTESDSSPSEEITEIYQENADGKYYLYEYDADAQAWSKSEVSQVETVWSPIPDSGIGFAWLEDMYDMDSYTFNEKTGAYELLDYTVDLGVLSLTVSLAYKFKDGKLAGEQSTVSGVQSTSTFYHYGKTSVELPKIKAAEENSETAL